jgi:hypothetical protein
MGVPLSRPIVATLEGGSAGAPNLILCRGMTFAHEGQSGSRIDDEEGCAAGSSAIIRRRET